MITNRDVHGEVIPAKDLVRRVEEARARMLFTRQGGCIFRVAVDGVTVYSVDLDTLPDDEPFPFSTDDFTPGPDSTIAYIQECPSGTTDFPELDIAGLVLITGPAALPPASDMSSALGGMTSAPPPGSMMATTIYATVTQVISGSTVLSVQTSVVTATATATVSASYSSIIIWIGTNHHQTTATAYVVSSFISTVTTTTTFVSGGSTITQISTAYVVSALQNRIVVHDSHKTRPCNRP
jgi:hypothetical protein